MDARRYIFIAAMPALIVAARFLVPGLGASFWGRAFATLGFVATLAGCGIAAWLCRSWLSQLSYFRLALVALVSAVVPLIAIFPTMPTWPFTGVGFVVAWCLITGALCAASLYVAYRVHA